MQNTKKLYNFKVKWADLDPNGFKFSTCINCETSKYESLLSITINSIEFFIVKCSTCGLMWRNPIPDILFLKSLYSKYYFNVKQHSPELIWQVGIPDSEPDDKN